MMQNQPSSESMPFLRGSEEQALKLRKRLEEVFGNVALAHDVVIVCLELGQLNGGGTFNGEIAQVLRRCAADRLQFQMHMLTKVIERLGGKTVLSQREANA